MWVKMMYVHVKDNAATNNVRNNRTQHCAWVAALNAYPDEARKARRAQGHLLSF